MPTSPGLLRTLTADRLLASVGITVPGVAYLLSGEKKAGHHDDHGDSQGAHEAHAAEHGDEKEDGAPPTNQEPKSGNPKAAHGSPQTGKQTPPTTSDNRSLSEAWDEKKEGHEQYKKTVRLCIAISDERLAIRR